MTINVNLLPNNPPFRPWQRQLHLRNPLKESVRIVVSGYYGVGSATSSIQPPGGDS